MATQSVKIPVELQLNNVKSQVDEIRKSLGSVKEGTSSYKELNTVLQRLERQFTSLQTESKKAFTSEGQISHFQNGLERLGNLAEVFQERLQEVNLEDLKVDVSNLNQANKKVQDLEAQINLLRKNKIGDIFNGTNIENAIRQFNIKIDKDTTFDGLVDNFRVASDNIQTEINTLRGRLQLLNNQRNNFAVFQTGARGNLQNLASQSSTLSKDALKNTTSLILNNFNLDTIAGFEHISSTGATAEEYISNITLAISSALRTHNSRLQGEIEAAELNRIRIQEALNYMDSEGLTGTRRVNAAQSGMISSLSGMSASEGSANQIRRALESRFGTLGTDIQNNQNNLRIINENDIRAYAETLRQQIEENRVLNRRAFEEQVRSFLHENNVDISREQTRMLISEDDTTYIDRIVQLLRDRGVELNQEWKQIIADYNARQTELQQISSVTNSISRIQANRQNQANIVESKDLIEAKTKQQEELNQVVLKGEKIKNSFSSAKTTENIQNMSHAAEEGKVSLNGLNEAQKRLGNIQDVIKRWFSFTEVINIARNAFRNATQTIQKLDKVITEIAIVTDMTQADLWKQINTYSQIALQYGVSTEGAYQVSMLWYQQGLKTAEVMELTTETLKMAKIAGLDYATATDYMTVALRGFKLEMTEAQNVTDVYSALAAATASSTQELAVAMSKTASSAEAVGASFESTSAMIATMVSVTRESATNIGSALKSIVSRYGEMTKDPAKLVDSEGEELSLNKVDKALQAVGLSLHDANGQFRDFDDVILELAEKWDTIDRNAQRYIATVFAGNRQQSRFLALVGNYDQYAEALETATNAEGAGTLQTLKTLDSIESKLNQLRTVWEQFYSSLGFEQVFKNGLDFLTNIIKNLNKMNKISVFGNIINIVKSTKKVLSDSFSMVKKSLGDTELSLTKILSKAGQGIIIKVKADLTEFEKPIEEAKIRAQQPIVVNKGNGQPTQIPVAPAQTAAPIQKTRDSLLAYRGLEKILSSGWLSQAVGQKANWGMSKILGSDGRDYFSRFNFTDEEYTAFTSLLNNFKTENDKLGKSFQSTSQMLKEFEIALEKTEAQFFKQKRKNARKESWDAFKASGKESLAGFFSAISKYGNVIGNAASLIGAAMTTKGLTITDKSTDTRERSKTLSGEGSLIGAAGSIISGFAIGGVPGLIASIITSMPTIIGGISNIVDGMTITTAERIEMLKVETEELKNQATLKKGESDSFKNSLAEYKKLAEAQYDSEEASKAFTEKMNEMAEEYPELISYMDAAGNAIIDAQKAEEKLAKLRYDTAKATAAATASEYRTKVEQRKEAIELQEGFNSLTLNKAPMGRFKEDFVKVLEISLGQYGGDLSEALEDAIYTNADEKSAREAYNALMDLIGYNEDQPRKIEHIKNRFLGGNISPEEMQLLRQIGFGISNDFVAQEATFSLDQITTDELYDFENYAKVYGQLNDILSSIGYTSLAEDFDINEEDFEPEKLLNAIHSVDNLLNGRVKNLEEAVQAAQQTTVQSEIEQSLAFISSNDFNEETSSYISDYSSMLSSLGATMVEARVGDLKEGELITDAANYSSAKDEVVKILHKLAQTASEDIVEIYDNLANYKISDDLENELKNYGLDEETTAAFIELYAERVQAARDRVLNASDGRAFDVLFNGETEVELITSYADFTISTINQIDDYAEDGLTARAALLEKASIRLLGEISNLDSETQTALQPIIKGIDWNDSASLISAIEAIEKYGETSGKTSDLEKTLIALNKAKDNLIFNVELGFQNATDLLVESYEEREKLASGLSSGLDFDEMIAESKKIQAKNPDLSLDDLFKFDEELGKWVYTQEGFQKTLELQAKEIEEQAEVAEKELEKFSSIANNRFFRTEGLSILDEEGKLTEDARKDLSGSFSEDQIALIETELKNYNSEIDGTIYEFFQNRLSEMEEASEEWKNIKEAFETSGGQIFLSGLNLEKLAAGIISEIDAEAIIQIDPEQDIEEVKNWTQEKITAWLREMLGDTSKLFIQYLDSKKSIADSAIEKKLSGVETGITSEEQSVINSLWNEDGSLNQDILETYYEDVSDRLEKLYEIQYGNLQEQLNFASKTTLDNSEAARLQELTKKTEEELGLKYDNENQNWVVEDLTKYRLAFDESIQNNTSLWLDSYSEIIEDGIEKRNKIPNAIADNINNLLQAKIGEEISLAAVSAFSGGKIGSTFTAQSSEDIYKAAQQIYDLAANESLKIGMSLEELEDSINGLFNNWIDMVDKGIEGSLSHTDVKELKAYFNLNDADFIETAEGLKLTEEATYRIHNELQIIKPLAAEVTLTNLAEKAMESEENLNNLYFVLEKIEKLEKAIAEAGSDNNRKAALQEELKLTEKIRDNLMEAGNAFNFMERDLPTDLTNPLSAWEGLGQAWTVLNGEDFKDGFINYTDLYNMITMLEETGVDLSTVATSFNGEAVNASNLIRAAAQALTSVDGEIFVDLETLGKDFNLSALGMQEGLEDGIKTLAASQIKIIDAQIAFLEGVVAFQELDLDEDGDKVLDLEELTNKLMPSGTLEYSSGVYAFLMERAKEEITLLNGDVISIKDALDILANSTNELEKGEILESLRLFLQNFFDGEDWTIEGNSLVRDGLKVDFTETSVSFSGEPQISQDDILNNEELTVAPKSVGLVFDGTNVHFVKEDGTIMTAEEVAAEFQMDESSIKLALEEIQGAIDNLDVPESLGQELYNVSQGLWAIGSAAVTIQKGLERVQEFSQGISQIPPSKTLNVRLNLSTSGGANARIEGSTSNKITQISFASGNARAKGTLMGELGPELYATGGHYYVAGQNGAEFVDLPDDAIVFNHLQTRRLLGNGSINGTGTAVTSEKKAVAMATGNTTGPAMASASDTIKKLLDIRAMWEGLTNLSSSDFAKKAGGGSGGGGSDEENKAFLHDLERWYNLLRQIEKLEQQITYEQAKRANMQSGYKYSDSLQKELVLLKKQQAAHQKLSDLQKDYYDRRREDLLSTDYSKIFTYDQDGLMQYVDGKDRGLDILATLNATDENGKAIYTLAEQLAYLRKVGFDTKVLETNADGTKVEDEEQMLQNFWDGVDGWMDELDSLYDSYNESMTSVQEAIEAQMEIQQEYIDNQLALEEKLLQAIIDREQAEIDRLEKEKEALEEATSVYIEGLNNALDREKEMYDKNNTSAETAKLQRQLAILQRSGGSASEIKSLQDQIDSRLQDAYFQEQQDQIDAIQEASNNQLEKLQTQIDLMTETLEYQKEHGLLWTEVYNIMSLWTPEQMVQFIEEFTKSYKENSDTQNQEDSKEALKQAEMYKSGEALEERNRAWTEFYQNLNYDEEFKSKHSIGAQAAFNEAYAEGGEDAARKAAEQYYKDNERPNKPADNNENPTEPENKPTIESGGSNSGKTDSEKKDTKKTSFRRGDSGSIVKKIQEALNKRAGTNFLVVDGIYGSATENAIKRFQRDMQLTEDGIAGPATLKKLGITAYKTGGLVDFTGPAWVDGTKSKPEAFLSASDTAMLKSKIFSNSDGSLKALVAALEEITGNTSHYSTENNTEQIVIQNAQVNIQPGVISNDYSARRAGEMALEEMVKIARKTTNRVVSR